jgi:hypothetical protein
MDNSWCLRSLSIKLSGKENVGLVSQNTSPYLFRSKMVCVLKNLTRNSHPCDSHTFMAPKFISECWNTMQRSKFGLASSNEAGRLGHCFFWVAGRNRQPIAFHRYQGLIFSYKKSVRRPDPCVRCICLGSTFGRVAIDGLPPINVIFLWPSRQGYRRQVRAKYGQEGFSS